MSEKFFKDDEDQYYKVSEVREVYSSTEAKQFLNNNEWKLIDLCQTALFPNDKSNSVEKIAYSFGKNVVPLDSKPVEPLDTIALNADLLDVIDIVELVDVDACRRHIKEKWRLLALYRAVSKIDPEKQNIAYIFGKSSLK